MALQLVSLSLTPERLLLDRPRVPEKDKCEKPYIDFSHLFISLSLASPG